MESAAAQTDPYARWSRAPKHWVEIPVQRQASPAGPVRVRVPRVGAVTRRRCCTAVAVGVLVAAAVLVLTAVGPGSSVADLDSPAAGTVTGP